MSEHTPGPWRNEHVCGDDDEAETEIVLDYRVEGHGSPIIIASTFFDDDDEPMIGPKEAQANARLMAAAPELFERLAVAVSALRSMVKVFGYPGGDVGVDFIDWAISDGESAIKKARGE